MEYCPTNTSLSILEGEVSRCFVDTLTNPLILLVALLAGLHQYRLYTNFSTPRESFLLASSCLYYVQIGVHLLVPVVCVLGFCLKALGYGEPVFGLDILNLVTGVTTWLATGILVHTERGWQLPISARHGHGPVLLIFWTLAFIQVNVRLVAITQELWWDSLYGDLWKMLDLTLYVTMYLLTCSAFVLGLHAPGLIRTYQYSAFERRERMDGRSETDGANGGSTFRGFWGKLGKLLPYMWPSRSPLLQLRVLFCVVLLIGVRVTNVFVPLFYKRIVDHLSVAGLQPSTWPWQDVSLWMLLKLFQGGGGGSQGLLNNWRSFLWIRVQQFTTLEIQINLFSHLHNLSLRWHLGRKTGEVLRIMDRGTNSINSLLQYLVFSILPTLVDIVVAVVYFAVAFNVYFGLIILLTMVIYLGSTIAITEWRTKYRRSMNEADNKQRARGVDSLLNAETVKYYSMEAWEVEKYRDTVTEYQVMEWKSSASLTLLNLFQSLVINLGLFATSLYCAYLVTDPANQLTVGDFVLLGTYFLQLMTPLNWLGSLYRVVQESFINMENMFDLMAEPVEVEDRPAAIEYNCSGGGRQAATGVGSSSPPPPPGIEFRDVGFHYQPEKAVLAEISFKIAPGTATALVGTTGCGKSTIAKLLFRLFDVTEGSVLVDGVDIRDYRQHSYRAGLGVVPQDTVLFNDTVRYNILYGRVAATDAEVVAACQMAEIHETILGFPDGYETVVGERGLKLSGGEKQRIAIARTLLKRPEIVIFDEATSSLDSETEKHIQEAIEKVSTQRTSLIIAHRLSTVVTCHQILVMDQGRIVERGDHAHLLHLGGRYARLWNTQNQTKEEEKVGGEDEEEEEEDTEGEEE